MEPAATQRRIKIVAAVIRDECGRCLLVRKSGTSCFIQAGGKPEPGEAPLDTLEREILEELGCEIDRESAEFDGDYSAPAANEADAIVEASIYRVALKTRPVPSGEIDEILWLNPNEPGSVSLAPLTEFDVLPRYKKWVKPSISARQ